MRRTRMRAESAPPAVHCRLTDSAPDTLCGLSTAPVRRHFVSAMEPHRVTCRRCRAALTRHGIIAPPKQEER